MSEGAKTCYHGTRAATNYKAPTPNLEHIVFKYGERMKPGSFKTMVKLMAEHMVATLKYGRPEPEGRDYDRVVFTDDAEDQQALMENLREVAKIKGYKQHERPDGFLTVSGDNQDLSVYPTSKRDKIYNAWELIEGGMSKDEAWDQIAKEAKDKIEFVHSCCGKPAGECAGCPSGSSLILKDEHESA